MISYEENAFLEWIVVKMAPSDDARKQKDTPEGYSSLIDQNNNASETESSRSEPHLVICGRNTGATKSQLIAIVLLSLFFFLTSSFYSIFAPFYPGVATQKGMSETQIGVIFGSFQFVLLVLSPIFGKYLDIIGVRFLFVAGLFLASGSEILFGFLDKCPDGTVYFIISVACRVVCAVGSSMGLSYAIVGYYFPNRISSIVALLETFNGLGMMVGPVIGGFLFEIGGYPLPFFFMGGLLSIVFVIALFIFPDPRSGSRGPDSEVALPILPLLKIPQFGLTLMMLFMGALSVTFVEPSIQLHLAPLNLSPVQLGLIFFIPSLLYVIITPFVGYVCDLFPRSLPTFMIISAAISAVAFCFIGPVPYFKLPLNLWIFISAFFLFGFAFGGLIIPVYSQLMKIAGEAGYPTNDLRTHGIISGVFSSVWSLGAMLGPISGGYLVDLIGFDMATFFIAILFILTGFLYACCHFCSIKTISLNDQLVNAASTSIQAETEPLLGDA